MKITELNRSARRRAKREIRKGLKKQDDRRSPFSRTAREQMMQKFDIEIEDGHWYATLNGDTVELLTDYVGNGKCYMRPWASKKDASRVLSASYHRIADDAISSGDYDAALVWSKRGNSTGVCANRLIFSADEDCENLKLVEARFCHDPLCPVCNWRKSVKNTALLTEAMDRLMDHEDEQRLLHLVLTVPNCCFEDLRDTFNRMSDALGKLTRQGFWKKRVTGYYAKYEWTASENPEMIAEGRIAHPHVHVLLTVPAKYFDAVPSWISKIATAFRVQGYNPLRSAGRCSDYGRAVCSVRAVLAQALLDEASDRGLDVSDTVMWRTSYRGCFQRLMKHVDEIAVKYRPAADADKVTVKAAVKAFATKIADVADPLYIDEPDQHIFLKAWQIAYGDDTISDVSIQAVRCRRGSQTDLFGANPAAMHNEMKCAVKEIAKYVCKDSDYLLPNDPKETDRRVAVLREQLSNLHTVSSGGLIKKYLAEVRESWKVEDDDLIHASSVEERCGAKDGKLIVVALWNPQLHAYVLVRSSGKDTEDRNIIAVGGSERCRDVIADTA